MWATIEISKDARGFTSDDWKFISQDVGCVTIVHEHRLAHITPAAARELALILNTLADEVESGIKTGAL